MDITQHPRYQERPFLLFFEKYVLYVLDLLPEEKYKTIQSLNLGKLFSTKAQEWPAVIEEMLQLSETLSVAIWDEWLRYQDNVEKLRREVVPEKFGELFADRYFAPESRIDQWTEKTLADAKQRIASRRSEFA
jgi:hypothetical protein